MITCPRCGEQDVTPGHVKAHRQPRPKRDLPPFAQQIKRWRRRKNWTQAAAAYKLGTAIDTLQNWESGRNTPARALKRLIMSMTGDNMP